MASSTPTNPDTMVTLKVNFEGLTRRFKLPLRDMGASTLEDKVRGFLGTAPSTDLLFERYSDSAGAYITLDPSNNSVYKQLYRAAKAKQKLKLRVTHKEEAAQQKQVPQPVTVEDVPESQMPASAANTTDASTSQPAQPKPEPKDQPTVAGCTVQRELPVADPGADFEAALLASLMNRQARLTEERPVHHEVPVVNGLANRDLWFSEAAKSEPLPAAAPTPVPPPAAPAAPSRCPAMAQGHPPFAVCCNSCDKHIPESHYHCSTCDDGDFDLCQTCVDQGITCYGNDHWLIKRVVRNGVILTSTTERLAPKPKPKPEPVEEPKLYVCSRGEPVPASLFCIRTCNCCVQELPERNFLHCTTCEDYDLCHSCFELDTHGHNPKHGFIPAVEGAPVPSHIQVKLAPGRNQRHHAVCDGCDKYINGVRHKCLDCPDWDYCSSCILNAKFVHPGHRFVPVYEPLDEVRSRAASRSVHFGICCDGPLCTWAGNSPSYITGVRYKCTVCHDTDFCANCEASPSNTHNKTHPLVKFKTPVRHVTVTTTGERGNGQRLPQMGDRSLRRNGSRSADQPHGTLLRPIQTIVDVKPTETVKTEASLPEPVAVKAELVVIKKEEDEEVPAPTLVEAMPSVAKTPSPEELHAVFVKDTVADGSEFPPNHVFEQTWVLRNEGEVAWPAGCSVNFVGGDYMGIADSNHPAGISELMSASESTKCYTPLEPGREFSFTVLLRTPAREGRIISYWRLTTQEGIKFGHRLWCEVSVKAPKPEAVVEEPKQAEPEEKEVVAEPEAVPEQSETEVQSESSSQMIFPKLETESPIASIHQESRHEEEEIEEEQHAAAGNDGFEDCDEDAEWDGSDDGFMTDEEYDILDASDEEYLEEQQKRVVKS